MSKGTNVVYLIVISYYDIYDIVGASLTENGAHDLMNKYVSVKGKNKHLTIDEVILDDLEGWLK